MDREPLEAFAFSPAFFLGGGKPMPVPSLTLTFSSPGTRYSPATRSCTTLYSISSNIWNIGMYMATIMPPTIPPITTIINGSMIEVRDFTVASTSDS